MILITKVFQKDLSKIKSIKLNDILEEITKYKKGLNNFVCLFYFGNRKVLKGYLLSKKVRVVILGELSDEKFMPFFIAKKESKEGWNITKQDKDLLLEKIQRNIIDVKSSNYEIHSL